MPTGTDSDALFLLHTFAATIIQAGVRRFLARTHFSTKVECELLLEQAQLERSNFDPDTNAETRRTVHSAVLAATCMARGLFAQGCNQDTDPVAELQSAQSLQVLQRLGTTQVNGCAADTVTTQSPVAANSEDSGRSAWVRREGSSPVELLKCINPREASLIDAASRIHLRFRLGGCSFPPTVMYKIFTHAPVADICSFGPRAYAAERAEAGQAAK